MRNKAWSVLFNIVAVIAMALFMVGLVFRPIKADASVPKSYQTTVILTQQKMLSMDGEIAMYDYYECWHGDLDVSLWDWGEKDYLPQTLVLDGDGSEFIEPYELNDDGMVGDIYKATVYTKGTDDPDDDVMRIGEYLGYVNFN